MKVNVLHKNGSVETLTLSKNMTYVEGGLDLQSIIQSPDLDHYFTPDGYYDGWGRGRSRPTLVSFRHLRCARRRDVCRADDLIMA